MMELKRFALAALLLLSVLALFGCTSNKYVPCCVKSGIYNTTTGNMLGNPQCYFENETLFGACSPSSTGNGIANCTDGRHCSDIKQQDECTLSASCHWDDSNPVSQYCAGGTAYSLLKVCADSVPQSCINEKCTAMMCGMATTKPGPPPASQDWDAEKSSENFANNVASPVMSSTDVQAMNVNLQGSTCEFLKMNQKLYNKAQNSRGSLWVNAFRFGVGESFSDFEQARFFFPATDKVCGINANAPVDRFTVYLNANNHWCNNASTYYECTKGGAVAALPKFKDNATCKLYCGNDTAPYKCNLRSGVKAICNSDGIAYDNKTACVEKCSLIDDPNACTNSASQFPFLDSDETSGVRYRMKYIADYMTDSNDVSSSAAYGSCSMLCGPTGSNCNTNSFVDWLVFSGGNPVWCSDFTSWNDGPWWWWLNISSNGFPEGGVPNNHLGELRTYLENHAYSSLDLDYEYYAKQLFEQYNNSQTFHQLPFECAGSSDCISGTCDKTHYSRSMCVDTSANNITMDCACSPMRVVSPQGPEYPVCWLGEPSPFYAKRNVPPWDPKSMNQWDWEGWPQGPYHPAGWSPSSRVEEIYSWDLFTPRQSFRMTDWPPGEPPKPRDTSYFEYYAPVNASNYYKPYLFAVCEVNYTTVSMCFGYDYRSYCTDFNEDPTKGCDAEWKYQRSPKPALWEVSSNGLCEYACEHDAGHPEQCLNPNYQYSDQSQVLPRPVPKQFYKFQINFDPDFPWVPLLTDKLGKCALNGDSGSSRAPSPPYLKLPSLGWCAGCTFATMAVQEVKWGQPNPGGVGNPRQYGCYEFRAEYNYVPGSYPYGDVPGAPVAYWTDGKMRRASVEPVLRTSNPSAYNWNNYVGNRGKNDGTLDKNWDYSPISCNDQWHNNGWWSNTEVPTPSAPYLKEKLTALLQSNVMPILDETSTKIATDAGGKSVYGPTTVCKGLLGEGAVIHVIGKTSELPPYGPGFHVNDVVMPGNFPSDLWSYLGMSPPAGTLGIYGKPSILARTELVKNSCNVTPMVGLEITPDETVDSLIGDPANGTPGKLHRFFFNETAPGYAQRLPRAIPDKYPGHVDMLMQDWNPMCNGSGRYTGENEEYEVEQEMAFSRAIIGNTSKPTLIWKFAFPNNSMCDPESFTSYLFNNTGRLVDSGIIGIIYSGWLGKDGLGYGPDTRYYDDTYSYNVHYSRNPASAPSVHTFQGNISTGLTTQLATDAFGKPIQTLDTPSGAKGALFCALQKNSKNAFGFIKYTYGQKLYADNVTCECEQCNSYDYSMGICNIAAPNQPGIPQLYCNDGTTCHMTAGNYNQYRCPYRCVNENNCVACSDPSLYGQSSFCRIAEQNSVAKGYSKEYWKINDNYWEFLTGLSPSEKCCLTSAVSDGVTEEYTYTSLKGTKMQSNFLQFPRMGEMEIDCGNAPDTSVLSYCNIRVPISQKDISCVRIPGGSIPSPPTAPVCGSLANTVPGTCSGGTVPLATSCNDLTSKGEGCCVSATNCAWVNSICQNQGSPHTVNCGTFVNNFQGCSAFMSPIAGCHWADALPS